MTIRAFIRSVVLDALETVHWYMVMVGGVVLKLSKSVVGLLQHNTSTTVDDGRMKKKHFRMAVAMHLKANERVCPKHSQTKPRFLLQFAIGHHTQTQKTQNLLENCRRKDSNFLCRKYFGTISTASFSGLWIITAVPSGLNDIMSPFPSSSASLISL